MAAKCLGAAASLALLAADDFASLTLLSGVHGVAGTFVVSSLQSLPPRIVRDDELARTNAIVSLTDEFAIVAGPVVGGLAIGAFGFRGAFVVDALTYLVGVVALPLVPVRDVEREPGTVAPGLRQALEGFGLVVRTPALRHVVVATSSAHLLYGAALLAEPLYVRDVLGRSPATFAALQAAFGVCLVLGGLAVARAGERLASFGWVAIGVVASGLAAIVYLGTSSIVVAFVGVALWGLCTALLAGPTRTLLHRNAAEAVHGRVIATDAMGASAAELLGIVATGALVASHGVRATIVVVGGAVAVVGLWLARSHRRLGAPGSTPGDQAEPGLPLAAPARPAT